MYGALRPGDVPPADAPFDDDFLVCESRRRGIDVVARAQSRRVGSRVLRGRPEGEILPWRRPTKPRRMTGARYRQYPKVLLMRQVTVDARDKEDRAERLEVVTTILDASIDGGQLLAKNLLRAVMAVAAFENGPEPRQVSFEGAEQAVTALAPKLEAARPKARPALIDAMLAVIAYHRVGDRPGRREPRARKRRRKPGAYLHEPRAAARQAKDRSKWF